MPRRLIVESANRVILAISAMVVLIATGIFFYEAFFTVPKCPAGLADCSVRQAHVTGSLTIAAMIAGVWGYVALWLAITRRVSRRRAGGSWLPIFWLLPALIVGLAIMLIG